MIKPETIVVEQDGKQMIATLNYARESVSFSFELEGVPDESSTWVLDVHNQQALNVAGAISRPNLIATLRETQRDMKEEIRLLSEQLRAVSSERDQLKGELDEALSARETDR